METLSTSLTEIITASTFFDVAAVVGALFVLSVVLPAYLRILRRFIDDRDTRSEILEASKTAGALIGEAASVGNSIAGKVNKSAKARQERQALEAELRQSQAECEKLRSEVREVTSTAIRLPDGSLRIGWKETLEVSRTRLLQETNRLRSRSSANLVMGIAFSSFAVIAMALLFFLFGRSDEDATLLSMLSSILPRLTMVVLLQITASFFLKMHASNEADIKQNKNEVTNLEFKIAAIEVASESSDLSKLSEVLVKEERNFILAKDQRVAGTNDSVEVATLLSIVEKLSDKVTSK